MRRRGWPDVIKRNGVNLIRTWQRQAGREVGLGIAALLVYFGIRNATAGSAPEAFANAREVLQVERTLALAREGGIQTVVAGSDVLVTLINWIYIWGHWPVILGTGVALFALRRDRYYLLRNAMFVSGALGFLFFALYPVAPPRLLDLGLVDTVSEQSNAYRVLQPPGLTNQYAAFPSLHAGWNLLVGIVLFGTSNRIAVRAFAVLSPIAMGFAVVATANHFVIDVVAGAAVVLAGLAVAHLIASNSTATLEPRAGQRTDHVSRHRPGRHTAHRRPPSRKPARRASRV